MTRKLLLSIALLAGLLLPAACATMTATPEDKALTQKVDAAVKPFYPDVWSMAVDGTVYLDGTVKTRDEKWNVEKMVRAIPGVKSVNSRIGIPDLEDARDKDKRGGYL